MKISNRLYRKPNVIFCPTISVSIKTKYSIYSFIAQVYLPNHKDCFFGVTCQTLVHLILDNSDAILGLDNKQNKQNKKKQMHHKTLLTEWTSCTIIQRTALLSSISSSAAIVLLLGASCWLELAAERILPVITLSVEIL